MQKFEESREALSQQRNIVVMADEAHRGQYSLTEKVVTRQKDNGEIEAKTIMGTARIIRDSLPKATYIGFTGTPIASTVIPMSVKPPIRSFWKSSRSAGISSMAIGAFSVPDRRKIPAAEITMGTRKGVAVSYSFSRITV